MRGFGRGLRIVLAAAGLTVGQAGAAGAFDVRVGGITDGQPIPPQYAFCVAAAQGHVGAGGDKNPMVGWSAGPPGTQSYAIIVADSDGPAVRSNMNQEGRTVPAGEPRVISFHWVLVDIPASVTQIAEGADSPGRVAHGKPAASNLGVRGVNIYTKAFATNDALKGDYYGYDGPCSPWNDERVHHYSYRVYALNVPSLNLSGPFDGYAAINAMFGHILAVGEVVGTYTTNPALKGK